MNNSSKIKIKRLSKNALIPKYQTTGSAGFDLHSTQDLVLKPDEVYAVSTGLAVELPDNLELQVRSRSGMAVINQVHVLNSPGTVDSDFRGEIKVILKNSGKSDFSIKEGDRIAQGVINHFIKAEFVEETEELKATVRSENGFGSTGK